ncbi:hypothetical protein [Tetragenococcus koreensis]|uniref:hypothetical protein n=1 Tax=Tetragenococcus koreensis TaxID=290335 RepID=UPI001F2E1728|nr:hypothetical protein [Tetragenococcus koreensis]MCF1627478.1 hypothetical protein [Tetragenococcus koreensis]
MLDIGDIFKVVSEVESEGKNKSSWNAISYTIPANKINIDSEKGIFKENWMKTFPFSKDTIMKSQYKDKLGSIYGETSAGGNEEDYKKVTFFTNYYVPGEEKKNYYYVEVIFE